MQIRWQFPLLLKQTQVSPLPIHAGEPHVAWSVYNQSGDFPIQPFLLLTFLKQDLVEERNQKMFILSFFFQKLRR